MFKNTSNNLFLTILCFILVINAFTFTLKLSLDDIKENIKQFKNISKHRDKFTSNLNSLSIKLNISITYKLLVKFLKLILRFYSSFILLIFSINGIIDIIKTKTVPYSIHINIILLFEIVVVLPLICYFIIKYTILIIKKFCNYLKYYFKNK